MIENKGFFSWQGNNLNWPGYSKWIAFSIAAALLILIFVFRKSIRSSFEKKDKTRTMQAIGIIGIIYIIIKTIIYSAQDYPLVWEHMQLHICRIHFLMICSLMAFRKTEKIKYIVYLSIMGALFAIYFGNLSGEGIILGSVKDVLFSKFKNYNVGPDNFFWYDFFLFHIFLVAFPVYLWVGYQWEMTAKENYRGQLFYGLLVLIIWTLNVITKTLPNEWKSNNWYFGPDAHNDYRDSLSVLSHWPQNLFAYTMLGLSAYNLGNLIRISLYKDRKKRFQDFKAQHKGIVKKVFTKK